MSTVDDRIVRMQFEGSAFEAGAAKALNTLEKLSGSLNLEGAEAGIEGVKSKLRDFNMDSVSNAVQTTTQHFSKWESFVSGIFFKLGGQAVEFGERLAKNLGNSLTKSARDGFSEYQKQMDSIQTIRANTGADLEVIQARLDELNTYADKTTYVFSDMTSAIGRFTAAGIGVDEATSSIKGFFNAAALAGADASSASRGVYQLSQAMSAGVIKLQDWRSIENASIDTEHFRNVIMLTAEKMGVTNESFKKAKNGTIAFRDSLKDGWLTADVMQEALDNMTRSTLDFEDAEDGFNQQVAALVEQGYAEDVAKQIVGIATAADSSAREVRTFKSLMDTLGEAMGSGWAETWRIIIGDAEESKEFFTWLSKRFGDIVDASAKARNALVADWKEAGGRNALVGTIANIIEAIERVITPISDAFADVFAPTGEQLAVLTENIARFTEGLVISGESMTGIFTAFQSFFMIIKSIIGIAGNGIRIFGMFASAFMQGFTSLDSIAGSFVGGTLDKLSTFLNDLHARSDKVHEQFEKMFELFKKWTTGNFYDDASQDAELLAERQTVLGSAMMKVCRIGDSLHSILWGIADAAVACWNAIKSLAKTFMVLIRPLKPLAFMVGNYLVDAFLKLTSKLESAFWTLNEWHLKFYDIFNRVLKPVRRIIKEAYDIIGGFFTALYDTFLKSGVDKVLGWIDMAKTFITGLLPAFPELEHSIAYYVIHPVKELKDKLVAFGGDDRVQYFKDWFKSIADTVGGPFAAAMDAGRWVIEKLSGVLSGPFSKAVETVKGWLSQIDFSTWLGPFSWAFDTIKNAVTGIDYSTWLTPIADAFESIKKTLTEYDYAKAFEGIKDAFKELGIKNPFKNFKMPKQLPINLETIKKAFGKVKTAASDATKKLQGFIEEAKQKIPNGGGTGLLGILSLFSDAFNKIRDYIGELKQIGTFSGIVSKIFGDLWSTIKLWAGKIKDALFSFAETGDGFLQSASGFFATLLEKGEEILGKISTFLLGAKDTVTEKVDTAFKDVSDKAEEHKKTIGDYFSEMLSNLPTPGEIASKIGEFFVNVKNAIVSGFSTELASEVKPGSGGKDKTGLKASLGDLFDFSGFEIKFPDFGKPIEAFVDSVTEAMKKWPYDEFDKFFGYWTPKLEGAAKLLAAGSGINFINSLAALNRGIGKNGEGIGEFFEQMPETLVKGMTSFGKALAPQGLGGNFKDGMTELAKGMKGFMSESKLLKPSFGKEFVRVATGIALLAASLFVLSKVPADRLQDVGTAMLAVAGAALAFVVIMKSVGNGGTASAKDYSWLREVGIAIGGIGIGLIALAGSIAILGHIPDDVLTKGMSMVSGLMIGIIGFLYSIRGIDGDLKGVGVTVMLVAVAIGLLVVPLVLLGVLWKYANDIAIDGIWMITILGGLFTGFIKLVAMIGGKGKQLKGAAVACLALTASILLLTAPVILLGAFPVMWVVKGLAAITGIAAVITIAMKFITGFVKKGAGADLALASGAFIALAIAIGLLAGVMIVLGTFASVANGGPAFVGGALLVFVTTVLLIALDCLTKITREAKRGLIGATAALMLLAVTIGLLVPVIAALGVLGDVAGAGIGAMFVIELLILGFIFALSKIEIQSGTILKSIAIIAVMVVAVGLISVLVAGLSTVAAVNSAGLQQAAVTIVVFMGALALVTAVAGAASTGILALSGAIFVVTAAFGGLMWIAHTFPDEVGAFVSAISGFFDQVANLGHQLMSLFIGGANDEAQINSPSQAMFETGGFCIEGFIDGVLDKLGLVDESGNLSVDSFMSAFDGFRETLFGTGEEGQEGILSGLNLQTMLFGEGEDGLSGMLEGLGDLPNQLGQMGSDALNEMINNLDTDALIEQGNNITQGLVDGLTGQAWDALTAIPGKIADSIVGGVKSFFGIKSPSSVMRDEVGVNIIQGLVDGLGKIDLSTVVTGLATTIVDGFVNLPQDIGQIMSQGETDIRAWLAKWTGATGPGVDALVNEADSHMKPMTNVAKTNAAQAAFSMASGFDSGKGKNKTAVSGVRRNAESALSGMNGTFKKAGQSASSALVSGLSGGSSGARAAASNLCQAARNGLSNLYGSFHGTGRNAVAGFVDGMNGLLPAARAKVIELMDLAVKAAQARLKINSPSKVFMWIGSSVGEGFVKGINGGANDVVRASSTMAEQIPEAFSDALKAASIDIADLLDTDYNPVISPVVDPTRFNYSLNSLTSTLNGNLSNTLAMGNLNYTGTIVGKLDDFSLSNQELMARLADSAIDYDLLGISVANALIRSGVHVELDGGELMGYLAGEIRDARRMYTYG